MQIDYTYFARREDIYAIMNPNLQEKCQGKQWLQNTPTVSYSKRGSIVKCPFYGILLKMISEL